MAQTKDEIAADRDRLAAENDALRARLTALGQTDVPGAQGPARLFLSEGDRQDLEMHGRVNLGGRSMTTEQVTDALQGGPQEGVEIAEKPIGAPDQAPPAVAPTSIRGFDYVYPSVARGVIDPKVAGTPGINGPAAQPEDVDQEPIPAADADAE